MSLSKDETDRIIALFKSIKSRETRDYSGPTYRDVPDLREIESIMRERLAKENPPDIKTLNDGIFVFRELVRMYNLLGRAVVAAKHGARLIELHALRKALYGTAGEDFADDLFNALRAAKYYDYKAQCADIMKSAAGCLPEAELNKLLAKATENRRRAIKSDPVEATEKYLSVIDEVEKQIDQTARMPHFCLECWSLKEKYLAQGGIQWRSPVELNPGTLFD